MPGMPDACRPAAARASRGTAAATASQVPNGNSTRGDGGHDVGCQAAAASTPRSGRRRAHHVGELLEIDHAVAIAISLSDDFRDSLGELRTRAPTGAMWIQYVSDLLWGKLAVTVLVKDVEGGLHEVFEHRSPPLHRGGEEGRVVHKAVPLCVEGIHDLLQIGRRILDAAPEQTLSQLVNGQLAITVFVQLAESVLQALDLLLVQESPGDDLQCRLLEQVLVPVSLQVIEQICPQSARFFGFVRGQNREPLVVQGLLRRGPSAGVDGQQ
mmetsp:Transcript_93614/g.269526  ORF Transcript_93614/g.269526 Transcript_93614/m.269526 type:complete len:269 (-) Transcript_93614:1133-1939(-)